jgi:5-deoxy-glucuronate isomerase
MKWLYRSGELASGQWDIVVDESLPGWQHTGLRIGDFSKHEVFHLPANDNERIIFLLEGEYLDVNYTLNGATKHVRLGGRKTVFSGTTDLMYLPMHTEAELTGSGRVAVGEAKAAEPKEPRFMSRNEVPVFVRGAGRESRQVHNFGVPENLDASRFIVVEVVVPSGNWSGIPAHKHDTYIPGVESNLEEIYYFEAATTRGVHPATSAPSGYARGYASDDRDYDVAAEVSSGDVLLVPWGWHGPVAATPGSDLYFFNVMAGPDPDRSWNITDDPNHSWIRESWHHQEPDARLPYTEGNHQ